MKDKLAASGYDNNLIRNLYPNDSFDSANIGELLDSGSISDDQIGDVSYEKISDVPPDTIDIRGWVTTLAFTQTDHDTLSWGAGTITLSDGTVYSIGAGNSGNVTALTYIYLDIDVSETALQVTTTAATAVGANKILVAVCQNVASGKLIEYQSFGGKGIGKLITAGAIAAGTITGNEIAANTIVANNLSVSQLSAISADLGSITAGTITGSTIRTKASGNRVQMSNDDYIYFLTDSAVRGKAYCNDTYDLILEGTDDVIMAAGGSARVQCGSSSFKPLSDASYDLGASGNRWNEIFCDEIDISNGIKIKGTTVDETDDGEWGFITALNRTGDSPYTYQYKFRTFNLKCGLITSVTSESDWIDIT